MPELEILKNRVNGLEKTVDEVKGTVSEVEDKVISTSDRLSHVEIWKDGNGARGAEARLQGLEGDIEDVKECLGMSHTEEAIERIASLTARAVVKNARERDRTAVERMRAWGPIIAALCAAVSAIVVAIIAT